MKIPAVYLFILIGLTGALRSGGASKFSVLEVESQSSMAVDGRDEASHGKDAEPNYEVVFPQDAVNRIDITLSAEAWAGLQAEMTEQFGEQGQGGAMGEFPPRALLKAPNRIHRFLRRTASRRRAAPRSSRPTASTPAKRQEEIECLHWISATQAM